MALPHHCGGAVAESPIPSRHDCGAALRLTMCARCSGCLVQKPKPDAFSNPRPMVLLWERVFPSDYKCSRENEQDNCPWERVFPSDYKCSRENEQDNWTWERVFPSDYKCIRENEQDNCPVVLLGCICSPIVLLVFPAAFVVRWKNAFPQSVPVRIAIVPVDSCVPCTP